MRDPTQKRGLNFDCLLTGPFAALKKGVPPIELEEVYQIQREVSQRYGCAFWDARSAMGGSIRPWQKQKLARRDGIHLSRYGYKRIAELFEESLWLSYQLWRSDQSKLNQVQMRTLP